MEGILAKSLAGKHHYFEKKTLALYYLYRFQLYIGIFGKLILVESWNPLWFFKQNTIAMSFLGPIKREE